MTANLVLAIKNNQLRTGYFFAFKQAQSNDCTSI